MFSMSTFVDGFIIPVCGDSKSDKIFVCLLSLVRVGRLDLYIISSSILDIESTLSTKCPKSIVLLYLYCCCNSFFVVSI